MAGLVLHDAVMNMAMHDDSARIDTCEQFGPSTRKIEGGGR